MTISYASGVYTQVNETPVNLFAEASVAGGVRFTTSSAHGYAVGDVVEIAGTTNYNGGPYIIDAVTSTTFDITNEGLAFVSDEGATGTVARGDKDLSNMTGLTGVTTTTRNGRRLIEIAANNRIVCQGAWSFQAEKEAIRINGTATTQWVTVSGGYLRLDGRSWRNGNAVYINITAIEIFGAQTDFNNNGSVDLDTNGSIDFTSCYIDQYDDENSANNGFAIHCETGCTVKAKTGGFRRLGGVDNDNLISRFQGSSLDFDGFTLMRTHFELSGATTLTNAKGFRSINSDTGITFVPSANNDYKIFEDLNVENAEIADIWSAGAGGPYEAYLDLVNPAKGVNVLLTHRGTGTSVEQTTLTYYRIVGVLDINVTDSAGSAIEGALTFYRDFDNSNRGAVTLFSGVPSVDTFNTADDLTYAETTDASGNAQLSITTLIARWAGGSLYNASSLDHRTENSDGVCAVTAWSYNHLSDGYSVTFTGAGNQSQRRVMFTDTNITQTTRATVDAYTTIDDLSELYDYSKSWKVNSANIEYPTISTLPIEGSGTVLDLGAKNLTCNTGAASVFAINTGTNVITIKPTSTVNAATKFDTIKTTGAIIGFTGSAKIQSATLDFPTAGTYSGIYIGITADFSGTGTFDLTGATITGTITLTDTGLPGAITVQVATGTSYTNSGTNITVQEIGDTPTLTISADSATATVRGFTNDTQTTVFSESDGSVDYEYPNTNPIDIEIVEQGYVPINEQDVVPFDGPINYTMDLDEAYNASHSLTITTHYTYNRATKALNILTDQDAFDVRSSLADTIRTNSSYYNTPLLLEAKPGGKRIDLIDGATITSMATWKGAGMERYDAIGTIHPIEKWYAIQSVQDITGASVIYRQTNSGDFTIGALTGGKFDETLKFYEDTTVPPDNSPETNNNSYLLIKALRVGYRQARNDVVAGNGGASLKADLYTIGLAPTAHDYAGGPIDLSASMALTYGPFTVGGKTISYKWTDSATNSGTDIADWINYMGATSPNGIIPGGTGLRWAEMPDMVIYVTGGVETAQGYREGATPTLVGFYMERGGADHPDMVRAQADDGTYYTPAQSATATISNFATTSRLQIYDTLNAVELYNGVPGATSYQFSETYSVDRDIRVRITNKVTTTASIMIEATVGSITASNPDVAYIANQSADTTYNNNAVDGDMVTGITINDTTDRVEIGIAGGSVPWKNIYAYQVAWLHTEAGIRDDFAFIDAPDTANYILTGFKIKNTSSPSVPLVITGGYGRDATTGASIDLIDTTGGSLFFAPDHVIPYATGSGVTSADKTEIIAGVTSSVSDTLPDAVWQSPKALPKLLSVE